MIKRFSEKNMELRGFRKILGQLGKLNNISHVITFSHEKFSKKFFRFAMWVKVGP